MPQPNAESQPRPEPAPETLSRRARPIDYQPTEDDVHLLDFVRTLYKRLWTAATAFLVIVLSVAVYSFTATPIYEATGKLLIETAGPNVLTFQEVIDEGQITADYYQTQYDLLQSRSLARTTLDRLNLWDHHEFGGEQEGEGLRIRDVLSGGFSSVAQAFRPDAVPESYVRNGERGGNFRWLGFRPDTRQLYALSSLAVLPSYYREGGYPRGLLEPMSMSKPVITTTSEDCRRVVEEGRNGYLVPIKNHVALAEAIGRVMGNATLREAFGRYSRAKSVREFDERPIIERTLIRLGVATEG